MYYLSKEDLYVDTFHLAPNLCVCDLIEVGRHDCKNFSPSEFLVNSFRVTDIFFFFLCVCEIVRLLFEKGSCIREVDKR